MSTTLKTLGLPRPLTTFIGRERELEQLQVMLRRPEIGLLTLVGVGGVGKTRLAIELMRTVQHQYADGVYFVSLAALQQPDWVLPALLRALGIQEANQADLEGIKTYLQSKQMLIVLDNFEHLLEATGVLASLLENVGQVTWLVTSRTRLRLYGEYEFSVQPLDLPSQNNSPSAAVQLFIERAKAIHHDFALTENNQDDILEICRRLDGLPLAIELAAARIRMYTPSAIRSRLEKRLDLLTQGARNLATRQQTLRDTLDWSFELLSNQEQQVFAQLAVFVGSWSLPAAKAICQSQSDIEDVIHSLLEHNLVQMLDHTEQRYTMLEIIHEYADEKLSLPQRQHLQQQQVQYYCNYAQLLHNGVESPEQQQWLDVFQFERANILAALTNALGQRLLEQFAEITWHMTYTWLIQVDYSAKNILEKALSQIQFEGIPRARLLFAVGWMNILQANIFVAQSHARESLALFQMHQDLKGQTRSQNMVAVSLLQVSSEDALIHFQNAIAVGEQINDQGSTYTAMQGQAWLHLTLGQFEQALDLFSKVKPLVKKLGDTALMTWVSMGMGVLYLQQQAFQEANAELQQALVNAIQTNHGVQIVSCLEGLATAQMGLQNTQNAALLWGAAQHIRHERQAILSFTNNSFGQTGEILMQNPDLGSVLKKGQSLGLDEVLEILKDSPTTKTPTQTNLSMLTARENEVLGLLSQGMSNKEIARELGTAVYTVGDQIKSIYSKLGVSNRAAATHYALKSGTE